MPSRPSTMHRRQFLAQTSFGVASTGVAATRLVAWHSGRESAPLIESIEKETLWRNRHGRGETWFHPRACMIPGKDGEPLALMNLQVIGGSDYFGQVHWSESRDLGRTWSEPQSIAALGRDPVEGRSDGLKAAVCDVTPQYHPPTDTVIALGHVVFYKGEYFARDEQLARYPVVRHANLGWILVGAQDLGVGRPSRCVHLLEQLRTASRQGEWRSANVIHVRTSGRAPDGGGRCVRSTTEAN